MRISVSLDAEDDLFDTRPRERQVTGRACGCAPHLPLAGSPGGGENPSVKISVLGTGMVGRALAGRLAEVGHEVVVGTRDPDALLARSGPDAYARWQEQHPAVGLVPAADAGASAELLVNATAGTASVAALTGAGLADRPGLVVLDVANALVFGDGRTPTLAVANTDSLGEQIQRAFPRARVVKALNTMNCGVMA